MIDELHDVGPVIDTDSERRPGQELARARERAGIGLRSMADTLRLPEKQLKALEADDYEHLPPPTFVRGYLRSYARAVGLDDDEIVAAYDARGGSANEPDLRLSGERERVANRRGLALALLVLALVIAASVGAWWWQSRGAGTPFTPDTGRAPGQSEPAASASAETTQAESPLVESSPAESSSAESSSGEPVAEIADPATAPSSRRSDPDGADPIVSVAAAEADSAPSPDDAMADTTGDTPGDSPPQRGPSESESATGDEDASGATESTATAPTADAADRNATTTASAGAAATVAETTRTPAATEPASAEAATPAGEPAAVVGVGPEMLVLRVDGRSWVEVYDARGRELAYSLVSGAEPLRLRGWAPFDVFLGNSPVVTLRLNGDAVEKSDFTRGNRTARFLVDADGARRP